jgi:phosphoglycolate phosphatase
MRAMESSCGETGDNESLSYPHAMNAAPIRAVILDLDGTLIDTAEEIAAAMDRTLDELRLPRVPATEVRNMIGGGVPRLVERALRHLGVAGIDVGGAIERFEAHYAQTVATTAPLFPGVMAGLEQLEERGFRLAVVTNKPRFFTEQLLERAGILRFFTAVAAGDDGVRKKPHGDMLEAACRAMGTNAGETLMLGDSDNDVAAARAAGCPVWCVPYGYNEGRAARSLRCDRLVETVEEAARLLTGAGA